MMRFSSGAMILIALAPAANHVRGDAVPMMGGGQTGMSAAAMKHLDIHFDGAALHVHVDTSVATPMLRPLPDGMSFSSSAPWSLLDGKAYNFQYGWNAGGFISLPPGTGIWIEQIRTTPGLEVYSRPPANPAWTPILGTDGSSPRWKWSGAMTHNAYAVLDPALTQYEAEYRVYLGDAASGDALNAYASDLVTLTLLAEPTRVVGDFNLDGHLTSIDIDLLSNAIRNGLDDSRFDVTADGSVTIEDHAHWVLTLKNTWLGDADLNGEFNSGDFVVVFQAGKYEVDESAGWEQGDWTADGRFGSSDLVAAFQDGGFEQGPRLAVAAVPEPNTLLLAGFAVLAFAILPCRARKE
jgi:hypothetical protein